MVWMIAVATAGMTVNVDSLEVNGQKVENLSCDLASGGLFATMAIVGAVSEQKGAFDKCFPKGGAFEARWTWAGGKTATAEVVKATDPKGQACAQKALAQLNAPHEGTCSAVVLAGPSEGATAAAATLRAAETPSEPDTP